MLLIALKKNSQEAIVFGVSDVKIIKFGEGPRLCWIRENSNFGFSLSTEFVVSRFESIFTIQRDELTEWVGKSSTYTSHT